MPTYAYACTACDHRFDAVQAFSDDSLTLCPECAGKLRKVYGSIGVTFKGSGFYRTDSRASGAKGSASLPPSAGSGSGGGSGSEGGTVSGGSGSDGGSAPSAPSASSSPGSSSAAPSTSPSSTPS